MTERPILFSAPMVRALLAGTKTQTRRIIKPQPIQQAGWVGGWFWERRAASVSQPIPDRHCLPDILPFCPYGKPGDRLWVRESWMPDPPIDDSWASTQWAGCRDGKIAGVPERFRHPRFCNYAADWLHGPVSWTPSIHMPRWASRILLEITGVRVERLQDISEADAMAEGARCWAAEQDTPVRDLDEARLQFRALWTEINGGESWDANPWVWSLDFKRVEAAAGGKP